MSNGLTHWHVASGLAGYGPDCDEGTPTFHDLGDALEYARDELSVYVDMAYDGARSSAEPWAPEGHEAAAPDYETAWQEVSRAWELETLRANLDPKRSEAPLYAGDTDAYSALQRSQAEEFPHDVSYNARLYLWDCQNEECLAEEHDAYISDARGGGYSVSFAGKFLAECPRFNRARALVRLEAARSGFYPSLWIVSDHGNLTLGSY